MKARTMIVVLQANDTGKWFVKHAHKDLAVEEHRSSFLLCGARQKIGTHLQLALLST